MKETNRGRACWLTLAGGVAALALASTTVKANIIVNGSFEAPGMPGVGVYYTQAAGWSGGPTPIIFRDGYGPFPSPQDGNQYFGLGAGGYFVSQTFSVPLTGDYILSWYDNGYLNAASALNVSIDSVSWFNAINNNYNGWAFHQQTITLAAGTHILRFTGAHANGAAIDNVSLEPAPVPNAGTTLAGLALAFTLLGAAAAGQGRINHSSSLGEGGLLHGWPG